MEEASKDLIVALDRFEIVGDNALFGRFALVERLLRGALVVHLVPGKLVRIEVGGISGQLELTRFRGHL